MILCRVCDLKIPCWHDDDEDVGIGSEFLTGYYHCPFDNDVRSFDSVCTHPDECRKRMTELTKELKAQLDYLRKITKEA